MAHLSACRMMGMAQEGNGARRYGAKHMMRQGHVGQKKNDERLMLVQEVVSGSRRVSMGQECTSRLSVLLMAQEGTKNPC